MLLLEPYNFRSLLLLLLHLRMPIILGPRLKIWLICFKRTYSKLLLVLLASIFSSIKMCKIYIYVKCICHICSFILFISILILSACYNLIRLCISFLVFLISQYHYNLPCYFCACVDQNLLERELMCQAGTVQGSRVSLLN